MDPKRSPRPRVFSAVQPSGRLHIGNYLGAMRHWVAAQRDFDCFFCIVDLHALTVPQDAEALRASVRQAAGLYVACGLDPDACVLFVQSDVPAHSELAWMLACDTPLGWLERMTQFKAKAREGRERIGTGLFLYPVLMAADVLLYDTDFVPVGADQAQHLELVREIAGRFNHRHGETFRLPATQIHGVAARVMGLDDPTEKMSKSVDRPGHAIGLLDPPDAIRRSIARAVTDPGREIRFDDARPGVTNLLTILQAITGEAPEALEARFAGQGYAALKSELADRVVALLEPIQARYRELADEPERIDGLLEDGAHRARPIAAATMTRVRRALGLH